MLHDKLIKLECYSRKNNLIFNSVPNSKTSLDKTICDIWSKMGVTDVNNIVAEMATLDITQYGEYCQIYQLTSGKHIHQQRMR